MVDQVPVSTAEAPHAGESVLFIDSGADIQLYWVQCEV